MTIEDEILTELAAMEWAMWLPLRHWDPPRPGNVREAREVYQQSGTPLPGGGSERERKRHNLAMKRLARSGDIAVFQHKRLKAPACKLSDAARERIRRLCGQPGEYSSWLSLRELAKHSKRPPRLLTDAWVSEVLLATDPPPAGRTHGQELALCEDLMAVALIKGWAQSNSDHNGRVFCAITGSGWARLEAPPPEYDLEGEIDKEAARYFEQRLKAALNRLETAAPGDPRDIAPLPLPVATMGLPYDGPWMISV